MSDTVRRDRGGLEQLVLEVCNRIKAGGIANPDGKPWTPHRLAQEVLTAFPGAGANPSTGAISDTLKRWDKLGFAEVSTGPLAWVDFTEEAETVGLAGLKERARANRPPRASKPQALAPSGAVTLEVTSNPQAEEVPAPQVAADDDTVAAVPVPAEALAEAEDHDGHTVVIEGSPVETKAYHHDDAEYAQGDPHPECRDDEQNGWQPRDEWTEADAAPADEPQPVEGTPAGDGEVRDVRSVELGEQEFTDQPRQADPFG